MTVLLTRFFVHNQQVVEFTKHEDVPHESFNTIYYVISISINDISINILFRISFIDIQKEVNGRLLLFKEPIIMFQNGIHSYYYILTEIKQSGAMNVNQLSIFGNYIEYKNIGTDVAIDSKYYYKGILRTIKSIFNNCAEMHARYSFQS